MANGAQMPVGNGGLQNFLNSYRIVTTYPGSSDSFTGGDEPAAGDAPELHDNPRNPRDARLNAVSELWPFPLLALLLGGIAPLLVSTYGVKRWRSDK